MTTTLYYIHDPMCSWCWAFRPTYDVISTTLPKEVRLKLLLGGLAPDTDESMPEKTRQYVQNHWKTIQQKVPGTKFNFEFWSKCKPRRSTYPACRAVIAARNQDTKYEDDMILTIQRGYYLEARNPSEYKTLLSFALDIGLNSKKFEFDLNSNDTVEILQQEIMLTQQLGINGFPAMLLETDDVCTRLPVNYGDPESTQLAINNIVNLG
jgi:putative protein-disulfide isomerase